MVNQLLLILGMIAFLWLLYQAIKLQPQAFSKEKLSKSFTTLGVLGLILIAVVTFAVLLLRR